MADPAPKPVEVKIHAPAEITGEVVRRQRIALNRGGTFHLVTVRDGATFATTDDPKTLTDDARAEIALALTTEIKRQAALAASLK